MHPTPRLAYRIEAARQEAKLLHVDGSFDFARRPFG